MVKKFRGSKRRLQRRAETERKIRESAYRLFAERGFENTRVEDIASEVGLVKSAVLYYYPHKEDILTAVLEEKVGEFFRTLTSAPLSDYSLSRIARFIFDTSCEFLFKEPQFFRLFLSIQFSGAPQKAVKRIREFMEKHYRPRWEQVLAVEREKREMVLFTVWALFLGICHAYLSGRKEEEVRSLIREAHRALEKIFS